MQYNLKGTNLDITPEIRGYIEKKLNGLDKLLREREAARTDVELEYRPFEEKTYRAELMLHDKAVVRAEARGGALYEAVDKAVDELHLELTRMRRKQRRLLRHSAVKVKEFLRGWRRKI